MTKLESVVKYGFIFLVDSTLALGGHLRPYCHIRFYGRHLLSFRPLTERGKKSEGLSWLH